MRLLCAAAAALVLLTACGGPPGRPVAPEPAPETRAPAAAHAPSGDRLTAVRMAGVVRIGVKADTPPFGSRVGGELVGFDIDLAHAISRSLGVRPELVAVSSGDRIEQLNGGRVDLLVASMTITRGRERSVDFSLPYFTAGQGLMVRRGSPVQNYLDLSGRPVGAVRGSTSADRLAALAPGARLQLFDHFDALLAALRNGQVEVISSDRVILLGLAAAHPNEGLTLVGNAFSYEPYGVAMAHNQSALRDAVNEAIQELWEDGRYRNIYDTWFGSRTIYGGLPMPVITPYPR
jgi:ABC-type amino acid transport substrate-binding protein